MELFKKLEQKKETIKNLIKKGLSLEKAIEETDKLLFDLFKKEIKKKA